MTVQCLNPATSENTLLVKIKDLLGIESGNTHTVINVSESNGTPYIFDLSSRSISGDISTLTYKTINNAFGILHEEHLIKNRFHQDTNANKYIKIHDAIVNYIFKNFKNLSYDDLSKKYKELITAKILILLSAKKGGVSNIKDKISAITDIESKIVVFYNIVHNNSTSIESSNKKINKLKEDISHMNKKHDMREHYAYIQEIEMYVMFAIVAIVILVAISFNFDKSKNEYVKLLVLVCVFMAFINYLINYVYSIENFSVGTSSFNSFKTCVDGIPDSDSEDTKDYKAISYYMDYLLINLQPNIHTFFDIKKRLDKENKKNTHIKDEAYIANFNISQKYYDIVRDTRLNMDIIYLVLYIVALSLLLNSWYLEMYQSDKNDTNVLYVYGIAVLIGVLIFIYRVHIRARQHGSKFYF